TVTHWFDAPPPALLGECIQEGKRLAIPGTRRSVGLVWPAGEAVGGAKHRRAVGRIALDTSDRGQEYRQVRPRTRTRDLIRQSRGERSYGIRNVILAAPQSEERGTGIFGVGVNPVQIPGVHLP